MYCMLKSQIDDSNKFVKNVYQKWIFLKEIKILNLRRFRKADLHTAGKNP